MSDKKKRIEAIKVAAAKVVVNDYGKYCDEERKVGRTPKSKADWADMLVKNAKARRKEEEHPRTSAPVTATDLGIAAGIVKSKKPAKKEKPVKDANEMSVSDVARECGIEPKVARARLRKDGTRAPDGRWPTVVRGSDEHARLVALFTAKEEKATKAKPAKDEVKGDEVDEGDEVADDDDSDEE